MKKDLFEMGANFEDGWSSNNRDKISKLDNDPCIEILTPQKHKLYFSKEMRRGKLVTIVQPFHIEKISLKSLLKTLKKSIGTGGTTKENRLEFQGDITDTLRSNLTGLGYGLK